MKKAILLVMVAMMISGCAVSRDRARNWRPDDSSKEGTFYGCLQDSQQEGSRGGFTANRNYASGGYSTEVTANKDLLEACMRAKGYYMRSMTGVEIFLTVITIPIMLPLVLATGNNEIY